MGYNYLRGAIIHLAWAGVRTQGRLCRAVGSMLIPGTPGGHAAGMQATAMPLRSQFPESPGHNERYLPVHMSPLSFWRSPKCL
jgi:hypothetical protein